MSFNGFDSQALDPTQFREQLRRNFSINLTDSELGATILMFDKVFSLYTPYSSAICTIDSF